MLRWMFIVAVMHFDLLFLFAATYHVYVNCKHDIPTNIHREWYSLKFNKGHADENSPLNL